MGHGIDRTNYVVNHIYKGAWDAINASSTVVKEVDQIWYDFNDKPSSKIKWKVKEMGKQMGGCKTVFKVDQLSVFWQKALVHKFLPS